MATSDLRKAAVVLLSLPSGQRSQLLDKLEPEQAKAVAAEMNGLGALSGTEQEAVAREFAEAHPARLAARSPSGTVPFQFLHDLPSDALLDLMADEHPQAIALVLTYLPPRQAAEVLAELTPEEQLSVICRIATIGEPSPDAVQDVEMGLKRRLSGAGGRPAAERGVASAIKIFNAMAPSAERSLLGKLAEVEPQLVREIRRAMFGVDVAVCDEHDLSGAAC